MIWLSEWWTFGATLIVLFLPGSAAALIIGLRGFTAAAAAAPLSLASIGAASIVGIVLPFRWSGLAWAVTAAALVVLAVAVAALLRKLEGARWRESAPLKSWQTWLPFAALGIAVALLTPRLLTVFGDPQNISQTFDNIYHLNAIRHIVDTGNLAPTRQIIPGFYPSLWHALVATVVSLSGAAIPSAVNVVSIVLAAFVWPAGCVLLTRRIVGTSTAAILASGVLSAGLGAFPLLMLDFGVLYPNVLSIALLPAALWAVVTVAGAGEGERPPPLLRWVLVLAWAASLALAHPSTLMALFAIGVWPAAAGFARWYSEAGSRADSRRTRVWSISLAAAGLAGAASLFILARPSSEAAFWGPSTTVWQAFTHTVTNGLVYRPASIVTSLLMVVGIVAILGWRRSRWWLVAGWVTLSVIYIVCAAFPAGRFRYVLTGTWYSDLYRIGALLPTVVVPLAAVGFGALVALLARLIARRSTGRVSALVAGATGIGLTIVVAATQFGAALSVATERALAMYVLSPSSPLITTAERDLILRLPDHVEPDEVLIGSPWTGTSLSYALADRQALIPHIYADLDAVLPPDTDLIVSELNRALDEPRVCDAVQRTGARWVLDFGTEEVHNGSRVYPGLVGLEESGAVELVDQEGPDARLYRVVACD